MKILLTLIAFTGFLLLTGKASAQSRTADSLSAITHKPSAQEQKQELHKYYKELLKGDSEKAAKVSAIMEEYKAQMKAVEGNESLSMDAKRAKFGSLIAEKNKQLKQVLTKAEQEQLIPDSERD